MFDAQHTPAPLVHDLDRGRTRSGLHPPHEHAHPVRLPTPPAALVTTSESIRQRTPRSATSAFTRSPHRYNSGLTLQRREQGRVVQAGLGLISAREVVPQPDRRARIITSDVVEQEQQLAP